MTGNELNDWMNTPHIEGTCVENILEETEAFNQFEGHEMLAELVFPGGWFDYSIVVTLNGQTVIEFEEGLTAFMDYAANLRDAAELVAA